MKFLSWFVIITMGVLTMLSGSAGAKIYLDFTAPTVRKLPLAIQTFKNINPASEARGVGKELHETLSSDLAFSGMFQVLDPITFIEDPSRASVDLQRIDFQDWRAVGAEALIQGTFSRTEDRLQVEFHLYDVFQRKQITAKRYSAKVDDLRKIAHKFANEVMKQITGEEGVFDTRVAYLASSQDGAEIRIMDYDGHNDKVVLQEKAITITPRWSQDGEKIVFTSYREGNPDLYQINVRTGGVQKISGESGINTGGTYSPEGTKLAYAMTKDGNPEIYVLDRYSKTPTRLTKNWATDVAPVWSPDSKRIAFMSDRAGSPQVYVMDQNGKNPYRLTFQGKYNATPAWSPRGDRIAISAQVNGNFQIATIKPDGGEMFVLTANSGNNEFPSWSPDGRFLCFSSTMDGQSQIYIMNANGANLRKITSNSSKNSVPSWSPRVFFE